MIAQSKIEEIIQAAPIEQVIGDIVRLKRAGANMQGLCPFHQEKTPSFSVSISKGIFKCFGCGKAGNVVNFLMEYEGLGYIEALKQLAERFNVEWPQFEQVNQEQESQLKNEKESLQILNNWAGTFFEKNIWESEEGKLIGLSYFEERGFREDIIKKFKLGYAPDQWTAFYDLALSNQYNEQVLLSSGLVKKSEQGKIYDAYRGRVIFPILGATGKLIAFAGRQLKKDDKSPKYVNSPETVLYHKSNELYGLFYAKNAIRKDDFVYLVEGYTDVISLHQSGVENVVASSGTSLTEAQIKLIKRHTENVVVLYDGDAAGIKASLRGIDMLLEQGLNVRVVLFPDGEDPDSFAQKVGSEAFSLYLKNEVKDFILFKIHLLLKESAGDPLKKAQVTKDIVNSISKIPDSIKRMAFVKEAASLLQMNEQLLITELNKIRKDFLTAKEKEWVREEPLPVIVEQIQDLVQEKSSLAQEQHLIKLLIQNAHIELVDSQSFVKVFFDMVANAQIGFENETMLLLVEEIHQFYLSNTPITTALFTRHSNPIISGFAANVLTERYQISNAWEDRFDIIPDPEDKVIKRDIESALLYLQLHNNRKLMTETLDSIKKAIETNNEEEIRLNMEIYQALKQRESQLGSDKGLVVFE
jgi:DNA primase